MTFSQIVGELIERAARAAQDSSANATAGAANATAGGNSTAAHDPAVAAKLKVNLTALKDNISVTYYLGNIWWSIVVAFTLYHVVLHIARYIRMIACINNNAQRFWAIPNTYFAKFKKHALDAPLFRQRHHREFKLSSAIGIGTLPSRLQMFFIVGYFAVNVGFCVWKIDFRTYATGAGMLLNRSGILAVMNMIPLFLLAGRNNPIIKLTAISFDTMNLIHRWLGRIVILEAITHAVAWLANMVHSKGWSRIPPSINGNMFITTGVMGTSALVFLLIQSPSPVRHAFYEVFLHGHNVGAGLAVGAIWVHLHRRPQQIMLQVALAFWIVERVIRFVRLIGRNIGKDGSKAQVELLPGDAMRVTVRMARPWTFQPGTHAYLYLPAVGLWTNHPFSLAWSEEEGDSLTPASIAKEKDLPVTRQDVLQKHKTSMSFIIRRRTGFTDKLYRKAASLGGFYSTTAFVEGPYGGEDLSSYGTVMLWAAGIGITHQLPYVRQIVANYANGTSATRHLTLVWVIQSTEHLEWVRVYMTQILAMPRRREILKILLFVTRPRSANEIHSPSSSVQMFSGRPNVQSLIDQEMQDGIGAAAVTICGTGALADELRRAVRERQDTWNVDFREESFSW